MVDGLSDEALDTFRPVFFCWKSNWNHDRNDLAIVDCNKWSDLANKATKIEDGEVIYYILVNRD